MLYRFVATVSAVVAVAALAPAPAASQSRAAASSAKSTLRLADGKPNLQGVWDFRTLTPLERPKQLADKEFLSEEEATRLAKQNADRRAAANAQSDANRAPRKPGGGGLAVGGYNDFWLDGGVNVVGDRRTSLIIDPEDGRMPALVGGVTPQVGSLWEDLAITRPIRVLSAGTGADGPEDRGLTERCLVGFNAGPPIVPSGYNNNMQLFQTSDYVAILNEMNHDVRIIPLDGRPGLSPTVKQWAGISRGHWEGDTLVVKTTNFTDHTAAFSPNVLVAIGKGSGLNLTERFRRADEKTLVYEFTVEDPKTFTRPFTVSVPMQLSGENLYEYACHEGNYGLLNILSGARADEAKAAAK
jgi:hypothetical protein